MYKYTEEILKIAKFMGITPIMGIDNDGNEYYYYDSEYLEDSEAVPFYDTWSDVMPVVIKIESLGGDDNEFDIFGNCVQLGSKEFVGNTKIEATIEAINWWISENRK